MRILVTGATGTVGRHVVDHLVTAGVDVRALTRHPETAELPGAEVIGGDLDNPEPRMFENVDRMYLLAAGNTQQTVDLAKQAGVQGIVTLSSATGDDFHRQVEQTVEHSGLEWTHVRPGMFMANLLDWAEEIRTTSIVRAPYAAAGQAPVHEADIAAVAATALLFDHIGQAYTLSGPESLTKREQAATIGKAIGQTVEFEETTPDEWRKHANLPDFVADWLLRLWARTVDNPEPVLPAVPDLLGRPARTLAEWATDHVTAFR